MSNNSGPTHRQTMYDIYIYVLLRNHMILSFFFEKAVAQRIGYSDRVNILLLE